MPSPIVVTGASGFLAKHVVRRLLEDGQAVRATLRTPSREAEVRAAVLPGLDPDAGDRLSFARADLTADAGWTEALAGASALVHTASPFPLEQPRDAEALIRPAVDGTRRALGAAAEAGVGRVVLTSSTVAVMRHDVGGEQDETSWASIEGPAATPYLQSKVLAERAAWDLARERGLGLTVINPGMILGPLLDGESGTSVGLVARLLRGRDPMVPDLRFEAVDVRDVAAAHALALSRPASEGERILAVAGSTSMPDMARALKAAFPDRRIPTRRAPDWLIRLAALVRRDLAPAVPFLGRTSAVTNAKARRLLGMTFIPVEEALLASARSLVERGLA